VREGRGVGALHDAVARAVLAPDGAQRVGDLAQRAARARSFCFNRVVFRNDFLALFRV
jgi:hypothetical protein